MGLTDQQRDFQKVAADFAKNELAPEMMKWDQEVIVHNNFYKFQVLMYTSAIILLLCSLFQHGESIVNSHLAVTPLQWTPR